MEFQLLLYTYTVYFQAARISVGSFMQSQSSFSVVILILNKPDVMTLNDNVTCFSRLSIF